MGNAIIIFDGVCVLCNASVRLIIKNDKKSRFRFTPMQSMFANQLLSTFDIPGSKTDILMLVESDRMFTASTAALRIARRMDGPWPVLYSFMIIPKPIRDYIYVFIAKRRYKLFGKYDTCLVPDTRTAHRFIE
jgi:predicted DCC family thiol-disulfide oxidoreductase YuxK